MLEEEVCLAMISCPASSFNLCWCTFFVTHTAVEKTFSGLKVIVRLHVFLFYDFLSQIITLINLVDTRCKLLSSFKPRGAGYESVHYGIINTRSMQSVRAY